MFGVGAGARRRETRATWPNFGRPKILVRASLDFVAAQRRTFAITVRRKRLVLQELQTDLHVADIRGSIRERLREYSDASHEKRSEAERADSAWRIIQNLLAEELEQLNSGLEAGSRILEKDRLALPDGSQSIDVVYRGQTFSIVRPKDRLRLSLLDPSLGTLPIEHVGSKLFIAGETIASALARAIARLVDRATAGVNSRYKGPVAYMTFELPASNAAKVESALNLARENGYHFIESFASSTPERRVFVFERDPRTNSASA